MNFTVEDDFIDTEIANNLYEFLIKEYNLAVYKSINFYDSKYDGDKSTLPSCPLCREGWIKTGNRAVNRELDAYCEEYELRKKYPFMGIKRTKLYFVFENYEEKRRKTIRYPKNYKFKTYQNY